MNQKLKEKILESVSAVLPITGIVLLLSILLVPVELGIMVMFLVGAILLVIGMGFFQLGAEMSMTPLGEGIGVQISKARRIPLIFLIGFSMGAIITISEPDLQVELDGPPLGGLAFHHAPLRPGLQVLLRLPFRLVPVALQDDTVGVAGDLPVDEDQQDEPDDDAPDDRQRNQPGGQHDPHRDGPEQKGDVQGLLDGGPEADDG